MFQLTNASTRHQRVIKSWFASAIQSSLLMVNTLTTKMKLARQIARERNSLRHLSNHQLRDIGLTREQVDHEIRRGWLDIPSFRCDDGILQSGLRGTESRISKLPRD